MRKKVKIIDIAVSAVILIVFIISVVFLITKINGLSERILIQISPDGQFTKYGTHDQGMYGIWIGLMTFFITAVLSLISYNAVWSSKLNERGNEILSSSFIILLTFHKIAFMTYCIACNFSIGAQTAFIKQPTILAFGFLSIAWLLFIGVVIAMGKTYRLPKK